MNESEVNNFYEFNEWKIHFEKFGSGPNPILLIPGAIGTGRTDFEAILEGKDKLDFDKFTIIAVEAHGWGKSRPPVRQYGLNVYNIDCECFHGLMRHLGYEVYSIVGFSEGSRIALLMAMKYKESVLSLVLAAFRAGMSNREIKLISFQVSVERWKDQTLKSYLKVYESIDDIQNLWNGYLKFGQLYNKIFTEDIYKGKYHLVRCPVLMIHGDKDQFVLVEDTIKVCNSLPNAKLHRFPLGEHDAHQKYSSKFVKLVRDHILYPPHCNKVEKDQFISNILE